MNDRDFIFWMGEELRRLAEPIENALRSPIEFTAFLGRYGWSPPLDSFQIADVRVAFDVAADLSNGTVLFGELLSLPSGDVPLGKYLELLATFERIADKVRRLALRPRPPGLSEELWTTFGADLLHGLVADYLEFYRPLLFAWLIATEVVEETPVPADGSPQRIPFVRRRIHWSRVKQVLTDPQTLVRDVYGWDDPGGPLRFEHLMDRLHRVLRLFQLPAELREPSAPLRDAYYTPDHPDLPRVRELGVHLMAGENEEGELFEYTLRVLPVPPVGSPAAPPNGLVLSPSFVLGTQPAALLWPFSLEFGGVLQIDGGVRLEVAPGRVSVVTSGPPSPTMDASFALIYDSPNATLLLGSAYSHRLQLHGWRVGIELAGPIDDPEISLELGLTGVQLVVVLAEGDSLLQALCGGQTRKAGFDAGVVWSSKTGLHFRGAGTLDVVIPLHLTIGPIEVSNALVGIRASDGETGLIAAVSGAASLGPVRVAVANVGVMLLLTPVPEGAPAGAFGDLDLEFGFKPPDGVGIVIEAGPVTGGGFLAIDREAGRYLGALQLRIYEIAVSAFGVIDTKLPGGREGFSFVILISAEFTPIQLGLGFTLNGVGGAIGIHRALSKEALDGAVRSGRLDHILFPSDPAAHAPEILADLQAFFPVAEGRYTFGPLAKIGWGTPTLIEAKVGLILELPHPVRLTLLGTVKAGLPTVEKRFVKLNLALVGQLDFDKKTFALDASLFDSEVGGFAISGDAALRLAWGRDATFALAIGGFNPQFQPPAGFPALRRVMVDISPGGYPRVTCQAYLAITSNTAQVGAKAELTAGGHWNVYGWITFDALFVFVPFSFVVDFSAGVALRQGTKKRASVTVHGMLKGPNPWFVKGKACVSFFFFDICVGFEVTLSEKRPDAIEPAPDLLTKVLVDAVKEVRNWSAELPAECDRVVSLAATVEMVVDPLGALVLRQAALPLRETISRYAGQKLAKEKVATYRIEAVRFEGASGSPDRQVVKDRFARAQFQELADAKKLSLPGFEAMEAGVRIGSDAVRVGRPGDLPVEFETWIVNDASGATKEPAVYQPQPTVVAQLAHVSAAAVGGIRVSGSRRYAVKLGPSAPRVALRAERYTIRSTRTLGEIEDATHPVRVALAEASEALTDVPKGRAQAILRAHVAANPRDRDELQVVAEDDLAA